MEPNQLTLWLIINYFFPFVSGAASSIRLIGEHRLEHVTQCLIYLCKEAGVDLSYTFDLQEMGPTSEKLTNDFRLLYRELVFSSIWFDDKELVGGITSKLHPINPLVTEPLDDLSLYESLICLSYTQFIIAQSRCDQSAAVTERTMYEKLPQKMKRLAVYSRVARNKLIDYGLLKLVRVEA